MARLRVGRVLGLLCLLVNLAWGLECAYNTSYNKIERFAQKLDSNFDPDGGNYSKTAHILEVSRAYVGKTLYCGVVMRLLVAEENMRLMCFNISFQITDSALQARGRSLCFVQLHRHY
ncbi:hypothetical protein [Helicobacter bizzozeronii]|uniref:Uncharacterized protein n=1 Tax=Helicobacter bizzozeronii (strain CIII-1) TaxID=1002804 RepID=F8KPY4_HELBC|nr:hypothetical protein [Helicobacter bizzozeronii]CCB80878.1 hypothetical protein HBZC1_18920 [Helicobacter bizzozeronii CIII-1]